MSGRADERSRRYAMRALVVALVIVVLGPPLGILPVALLGWVVDFLGGTGGATGMSLSGVIGGLLGGSLAMSVYSYVFGGLQAIACALWLAPRTYRHGGFSFGEALATALVVSAAAAVVFVTADHRDLAGALALSAFLGAFACLSALMCRLVLGLLGIVPVTAGSPQPPKS